MKRTCPNCNSPLLETDDVCWHCGKPQILPAKPESETEIEAPEPAADDETASAPEPIGAGLILFYGILTLIIILAFLIVTRSLGQSPILALKSDSVQGEWIALTAPDNSFSIEIPAAWQWEFKREGQESMSFSEIPAFGNELTRAVQPLGDLVPDLTYLLIAQDLTSLLVVTQSERLNRLSPAQAVASMQDEEFQNMRVAEVRRIQLEPGGERASFSLIHENPPLRCDQHLVPGQTVTYLVAACTAMDDYNLQRKVLQESLNSFTVHTN